MTWLNDWNIAVGTCPGPVLRKYWTDNKAFWLANFSVSLACVTKYVSVPLLQFPSGKEDESFSSNSFCLAGEREYSHFRLSSRWQAHRHWCRKLVTSATSSNITWRKWNSTINLKWKFALSSNCHGIYGFQEENISNSLFVTSLVKKQVDVKFLWELALVSYWIIILTRLELAWNWTQESLSVVNYISFNKRYS